MIIGEFNLYQLDMFIEKAVAKTSTWDVGAGFDFMFGTDIHILFLPAIYE